MTRWMTVLIAGAALALGGCADAPGDARNGDAALAGGGAAEQAAAEQAAVEQATTERVYVDVRTPQEFAAGHVVGAINIPHTELGARHQELEPYADREIVLYCRTGRRSGIAEDILERAGYTNLTNAGGLSDLQARGVPTTR